jgi:chorismate-pyruvate lyase
MIQEKILIADQTANMVMPDTPLDNSIIEDQSLSIFQKILLTTDGTVTNLLALYTGEKIRVKKIAQGITLSGEPEAFLCPPETPILKRTVLLSGKTRNYVYADSIFVFELHSRSIQYQLLETDRPIGLLWKEEKMEMYREIIEYKNEPCESLASYFEVPPRTPILSRTYLIYHQQKILGVITEKFPVTYFKGESE